MTASGCGGSAPPVAPAPTTASPAATSPATPAATATTAPATNDHVRVDASGKKWIDDIPYDVFFDDPLAIASNNAAVAGTTGPATPTTPAMTTETPAAAPPTASNGGGIDWKSLITMEQITDETKRIRNHLTASLQSQGTYNGNYKDLQVDGAMIAALAELVALHPDSVSWKQNSRFAREYGKKLHAAANALGRDSYDASQSAAEGIQAVLNGNVPADAGDPPAMLPFGEAADRSGVMKRIEKASEWMRANINSESVFNKELDQIRQESTMITVLGTIISDHSYTSADEEDYANFAKSLVDGAKEATLSVEEKSYPKFQDAINKVTKACAECHASYGNG
ncbi:hypothetical protein GC163_09235 [bacterium]|nr:hypothetical protein [bacterium]